MSSTGLERYLMLLRTESLEFALLEIYCTCRLQLKSDDKYIPKCLCSFTLSMGTPSKRIGGDIPKSLFENIISFVFLGLKFTFHFVAQSDILSKSLLRISVVSAGFLPVANMQVSSANNRTSLSISSRMSFAYKIHKSGPSLLLHQVFHS